MSDQKQIKVEVVTRREGSGPSTLGDGRPVNPNYSPSAGAMDVAAQMRGGAGTVPMDERTQRSMRAWMLQRNSDERAYNDILNQRLNVLQQIAKLGMSANGTPGVTPGTGPAPAAGGPAPEPNPNPAPTPQGGMGDIMAKVFTATMVTQAIKGFFNLDKMNASAGAGAARFEAPQIAAMESSDPTFLYKQRYLNQASNTISGSTVGTGAKYGVMGAGGLLGALALSNPIGIAAAAGVGLYGGYNLVKGAVTGGESFEAEAAENRNQMYEDYMSSNPYEKSVMNYIRQNGQRDLSFQRQFGLSDKAFGDFRSNTVNAGFRMQEGMETAGEIMSAGGGTAVARNNSVTALQAARDNDITNAGTLMGRLGSRMSSPSAEQAFKKIMAESVKIGLDASETRRVMEAVTNISVAAGASGSGGISSIAERFTNSISGTGPAGVTGAMTADDIANRLQSRKSGLGGALKYHGLAMAGLGGLSWQQQDAAAGMTDADVDAASDDYFQPWANRTGKSISEIRESIKSGNRYSMTSTAGGAAAVSQHRKLMIGLQDPKNRAVLEKIFGGAEGVEHLVNQSSATLAVNAGAEDNANSVKGTANMNALAARLSGTYTYDRIPKQMMGGSSRMSGKDTISDIVKDAMDVKPMRNADVQNQAAANSDAQYLSKIQDYSSQIAAATAGMLELMRATGTNTPQDATKAGSARELQSSGYTKLGNDTWINTKTGRTVRIGGN